MTAGDRRAGPVVTELNCNWCGTAPEPGDRFCENCGAELRSAVGSVAQGRSARRYQWLIAGVVLAVFVVVVARCGVGGSGMSIDAPRIPDEGEAWSTDVDGWVSNAHANGDRVFLATSDDDPRIVVLDRDGGGEIDDWAVDGDGFVSAYNGVQSLLVVDGLLVVATTDYEADGSIVSAFDADSGEDRWQIDVEGSATLLSSDGDVYLNIDDGDDVELERLDLDDGTTAARETADYGFRLRGDRVIAVNEDSVEVLDPRSLDRIGDPIDYDSDAYFAGTLGDGFVLVEDDEIQVVDADGDTVWSYESSSVAEGSVEAADEVVIITSNDDAEGIVRDGDDGDREWRVGDGGILSATSRGLVLVAWDGGAIYDVRSGDELLEMEDADDHIVLFDGYVAVEGDPSDCTIEDIEGYRLERDAERLWSLSTDMACVFPTDDAIVVVETEDDETRVTFID